VSIKKKSEKPVIGINLESWIPKSHIMVAQTFHSTKSNKLRGSVNFSNANGSGKKLHLESLTTHRVKLANGV
jgi:hypothetical protein